jgi:hypothetical protein
MTAENETKRIAHLAELQRRAWRVQPEIAQEAASAFAGLLQKCGDDPTKLMALTRVLMSQAAEVAYGTVGLPCDLQIREGADMHGMVDTAWQAVCAEGEDYAKRIGKLPGAVVPQEVQDKVRLAPSDPAQRPGLAPLHALPEEKGPPRGIEDLFEEGEEETAAASPTAGRSREADEDAEVDEILGFNIGTNGGLGGMMN